MILVAGGDADPNLARLLRRLAEQGEPHRALLFGAARPEFAWDLQADTLTLDGEPAAPGALFLRYDVFAHLADQRPESRARASRWYTALLAWALAHEDVRFLNRAYGTRQSSKPHVLLLARRHGLAIAPTRVATRHAPDAAGQWIVKPVGGGEHTRPLDADARWDAPTIVQQRLVGPELRIYRVGPRWFGFLLRSPQLDYRADPRVEVAAVPAPPDLTGPLGALMDALGLEFGAADFKRCPETGRQLFLEVNSAPMFAAFDRVAEGALTAALIGWLSA